MWNLITCGTAFINRSIWVIPDPYAGGSTDWAKKKTPVKYAYTIELRPSFLCKIPSFKEIIMLTVLNILYFYSTKTEYSTEICLVHDLYIKHGTVLFWIKGSWYRLEERHLKVWRWYSTECSMKIKYDAVKIFSIIKFPRITKITNPNMLLDQ